MDPNAFDDRAAGLEKLEHELESGRITRREFGRRLAALALATGVLGSSGTAPAAARLKRPRKRLRGPLRVHPDNPRYFTDGPGRAPLYLAGTGGVWGVLQDGFVTEAWGRNWADPFDYDAFLDLHSANDLNYMRLWLYETASLTYGPWAEGEDRPHPLPWPRTGPGTALDGGPKFDLTKFDNSYFERLRDRVEAAGDRGIYVAVMLFEGWSATANAPRSGQEAWQGHPFNAANNINGINGDPNGDGFGLEIHSLAIPEVIEIEERYVRKVVDTVYHLDNVLFEICNENHDVGSGLPGPDPDFAWQHHITDVIRNDEAQRGEHHPVLISSGGVSGPAGSPKLYESRADAIAPAWRRFPQMPVPGFDHWFDDPPAADGRKVVIMDTDHGGGVPGSNPGRDFHFDLAWSRAWAWKAFTRGYNPALLTRGTYPGLFEGHRALGDTRRLAQRIDLAMVTPQDALSSTGYCLAHPGSEYVVYQPGSGAFDVALAPGSYAVEWLRASDGRKKRRPPIRWQGGTLSFTPPFEGDVVLYLRAKSA